MSYVVVELAAIRAPDLNLLSKGQSHKMRLHSIAINNLRSVEATSLDACGDFNVLIGKNNSGKSNLLSAIDHFYRFLSRGVLATHDPSLRQDVDYFNRNVARSIQLTATLQPTDEDLALLFQQIGDEFPQVQNALPSSSAYQLLEVQVEYMASSKPIACINSVRCISSRDKLKPLSILTIPPTTAALLAERLRELEVLDNDSRLLDVYVDGLSVDVYERTKQRPRSVLSVTLRDELSDERLGELSRILERSHEVEEARSTVQDLVLSLRTRAEDIRSAGLSEPLDAFAGSANVVPDYVTSMMNRFSDSRVLLLADRRRPIGSAEAGRLLQLKMSRGGGDTLRNIQSIVSSLLGVQIDAFASQRPVQAPSLAPRRRGTPDAELDVDDFLVEVNGSGIRESLRLLLDMEFEKPQILLVEEPEVHLHPALEVAVMRYLKSESRHTQVFLTTHSTNFLDTGDMQNVYMVQNPSSTQVQRLDLASAETELPKELGIRLSSIFMFDRLVFVEGASDELVLRAFAHTLGLNLSRANVGFVIMGSARNFTHYAAEATMALLSKRQVECVFLLDRDEHRDSHFDSLSKILGDRATLHVLERREIENYLCDPEAVADYLLMRSDAEGKDARPTAEDVEAMFTEEAGRLRELSVAKRVAVAVCGVHRADRKIFLDGWKEQGLESAAAASLDAVAHQLDSLRQELGERIAAAEEEVDTDWERRKLLIVPGHELLDGVFGNYDSRFRKDRDAARLAALVPRDKIPRELVSLLEKICV
jgi:predicted ATPase